MTRRADNPPEHRNDASFGFLVLGMHRSGTSVLTRLLQAAGADPGGRLVPGSKGNDEGHWEDAFAVETNDRLLHALGRRWDDLRPLPDGWQDSAAAREAAEAIADYARSSLQRRPLWALKDPRLCLLGELWLGAMAQAGSKPSVLLLSRHPLEVAESLRVRDGLAQANGGLLWLRHSLGAERLSRGVPRRFLSYQRLLADWRGELAALRSLPGGDRLQLDDIERAAFAVDPRRRHHDASRADALAMPGLIDDAWQALDAAPADGAGAGAVFTQLQSRLQAADDLFAPVLGEVGRERDLLWDRTARAEAQVASTALGLASIPHELLQLRELVQLANDSTIGAIGSQSADFSQVQSRAITAISELSQSISNASEQTQGELVHQVTPRLRLLEQGLSGLGQAIEQSSQALTGAISGEIRRMQEQQAAAMTASAHLQGQAELAQQVAPRLGLLEQGLGGLGQAVDQSARALTEAISTEIRRMQEATAAAMAVSAVREREANLTRELGPRLQALADGIELNRSALVTAISDDLRRMQTVAEAANIRAAQAEARLEAFAGVVQKLDATVAERTRLEAELDARQRELAAQRHELDLLRDQAEQLERVKASRSWRWTRPMRVALRLLRGEWADSDAAKLRKMARNTVAKAPLISEETRNQLISKTVVSAGGQVDELPDETMAKAIPLAERQSDLPDVFVWSVIDWHFRFQRPQHLAQALAAKGHRVFYISNNFFDAAAPGFHIDPLSGDGRLFQIHLNLAGKPPIYFSMPGADQVEALRASLAALLAWTCSTRSVSLVQHPYWSALVRAVPNAQVVYDCMDHHAGFENNAPAVLEAEHRLVVDSDLVIVTSSWLQREIGPQARAVAMIRNAGEFEFFRNAPAEVFRAPDGRGVIGYYGAIAEWFDIDLVRRVASAHPDDLVVLVGNDTVGAGAALADLDNVRLVGEVPYAQLPYWLHGFDICLLPFKVIPLTLATNPVKVYEYLSAGKPVVVVDLPEMAQFDGLVSVAGDADAFVAAVGQALAQAADAEAKRERQAFAAEQTWAHRAEALDQALLGLAEPVVSVVVLTYNNLAFTEACLFSLEAYSDYPNLEVIVVDNASSDGSREWLQGWVAEPSAAGHRRRLILNDANLGFAAGNNVGLAAATGEMLVMLNNDTYVTPGWVRTMHAHLRRDPTLGLIGPVTNNIGNEAKVAIAYTSMTEMIRLAGEYTRRHPGASLRLRTAAFFCVGMLRPVYEKVGGLDEAFGVGFFEDDDYCRRVEQHGWHVACAEDIFIHHHLSASFDALKAEKKQELFVRNKAIYEAKWGPWQPHAYRTHGEQP